MKSNVKRTKRIDITQDYEPMSRVKSKLVKDEKPSAEQMDPELSKPERKLGRTTLKKKVKGQERKSWLSTNEWRNYGHFF